MAEPRTISSKDNPLLVRVRKLLADPGGYRKLGEVWLEGEHLCAAFVQRGGRPLQAIVSAEGLLQPALRELAGHAAAVAVVPGELMAALSTLESPPAIGFVVATPTAPAITPDAPSLVLDRLQDAGNVGTILRSAAAFGFTQVVALKGTAALWSPKVLRAGMGAHFALRLCERLREDEVLALALPLVGTSPHADELLPQAALPQPVAWLLGHEGQGASARLLASCATTVRIPQPGGEESLNVAAAAAICFYEALRRRG